MLEQYVIKPADKLAHKLGEKRRPVSGSGAKPEATSGTASVSASGMKPAAPKAGKASVAAQCQTLEQIPNIGPSLAQDLRDIGIKHPRELANKDAFVLYQQLCAATGQRHDPCVLDTFMAATDFMRGAAAAPWWHYTAHRKALYGQIETTASSPAQPPAAKR